MRRTHLRRHENIIKRLLINAGTFNLRLVMRKACGYGTPRGLGDAAQTCILALLLSTRFSPASGASFSRTESRSGEALRGVLNAVGFKVPLPPPRSL
jgi:hypothetical protein